METNELFPELIKRCKKCNEIIEENGKNSGEICDKCTEKNKNNGGRLVGESNSHSNNNNILSENIINNVINDDNGLNNYDNNNGHNHGNNKNNIINNNKIHISIMIIACVIGILLIFKVKAPNLKKQNDDELMRKFEEMKRILEKIEEENRKNKKENEEIKKKYKEMKKEKKKMEDTIEKMKKENEEIKKKYEEMKNENKKGENTVEKMKKINKIDKNLQNKTIVGIDFGSIYSGFGYIINIQNKNDCIEISDKNKYPTSIIIKNSTKKLYKFGQEAEFEINNDMLDDYIYFDRIKMNLDPQLISKGETEIYITAKKPQNYRLPLRLVITEYLKGISDKALYEIRRKGQNLYKSDIKWIITVPAIWNEFGKQLMRKCGKNAGLSYKEEEIDIALEPEAASLTMFYDNNILSEYKQKGKIFMLVDAGGYTIDITLNEIVDEFGNLKQLSPPYGGADGSININNDLTKIVEEVLTNEKVEKLKNENFNRWKAILSTIEDKKKGIKIYTSDAEIIKIDVKPYITCSWISDKNRCTTKTSFGEVSYDNDYIYIPFKIVKSIINNYAEKVLKYLKEIEKKFKNINIDMIVTIGGFSNDDILSEKIKKNFAKHYVLKDPQNSVMKGAVLYGIDPNKIISRKAPYTIGIATYMYHKEGTECRDKRSDENNKDLCLYFLTFISKGKDIQNNYKIAETYTPIFQNQTDMNFKLYYSELSDTIYINEDEYISEFTLEINETYLPVEQRKVEVTMEFSSCITITAKNVISGNKVEIFANYYNIKN